MILSASSIKVGTKRSAIVIIMAISCAGTPTRFAGCMRVSKASVRASGDVVYVRSADKRIRSANLSAMKKPFAAPCQVRSKSHTWKKASPGVLTRWMTNVKAMIHESGFSALSIKRSGTRLTAISAAVNAVSAA